MEGLDQRLMDRMEAFKEVALIHEKLADVIVTAEFNIEQTENKLLVNAIRGLLPYIQRLMEECSLHLVEIMLDGDPRYYGDEEE